MKVTHPGAIPNFPLPRDQTLTATTIFAEAITRQATPSFSTVDSATLAVCILGRLKQLFLLIWPIQVCVLFRKPLSRPQPPPPRYRTTAMKPKNLSRDYPPYWGERDNLCLFSLNRHPVKGQESQMERLLCLRKSPWPTDLRLLASQAKDRLRHTRNQDPRRLEISSSMRMRITPAYSRVGLDLP